MIGAAAYKAIKDGVNAGKSNVNAAKGYALTYQFANWMDEANGASTASQVPAIGKVVNTYTDTLEENGFTAENQYTVKGYANDRLKTDEATFRIPYDATSKANHAEFMAWLAAQLNKKSCIAPRTRLFDGR